MVAIRSMSGLHELFDGCSVGVPKSMRVLDVLGAATGSVGCVGATIDGGGGRGIAGIVNSMGVFCDAINGGWLLSDKLWWPWWPWPWPWPWWWWWCGNDFGKIFCLLESVVRDNRSLNAFRAICRRRSMSCISTLCTDTTDVSECAEFLNTACGFMMPMRMNNTCNGLTRIPIAGWKIVGKKLRNEHFISFFIYRETFGF